MDIFHDVTNQLYCEEVPVSKIAFEVGTPFYLYSYRSLTSQFKAYDAAFQDIPHLICYAVKANSNLAILKTFGKMGGGADIVSGGELFRSLRAGIPSEKIVFAGVGKMRGEIASALRTGIYLMNVESFQELQLIDEVAKSERKTAPVAIRVNPSIDPMTHPYISTGMKESKFGIDMEEALEVYLEAKSLTHVKMIGVHQHIGSQLTELAPFVEAIKKVAEFIQKVRSHDIHISVLDIGGGLGIPYEGESAPSPSEMAAAIIPILKPLGCRIILEPGRSLVGKSGSLISRVLYTKTSSDRSFVVVDAGMSELIRPSLYQAYHEIRPLVQADRPFKKVDVVGPVCESGDFFAKEREMGELYPGEYLAIMDAGAYGFSMSSHYNSRPNVPEVLVNGSHFSVIREREDFEDLVRREKIPPFLT
ncbi:MAG: diaminopimelate decarboxylase [Nitrospirae bacterium]|nr:diaminopimelate decarboxylase [Nitrospirota bacterium]MBI3594852.1 diaminopimelate decarboxylase [Nitrospirota bacterium]